MKPSQKDPEMYIVMWIMFFFAWLGLGTGNLLIGFGNLVPALLIAIWFLFNKEEK